MKLFAVLVATLALLAGFAGGMRAYSVAAPAQAAPVSAPAPHHPKAQPVRPGPTFKWAPCKKPAVLEGRTCVTHVVHTVTIPAPAVAASAPVYSRAPHYAHPTSSPSQYHEDDGGNHHEDDGGGGHDD